MAHPHLPILLENWRDELSAEWLYLRLARLSGTGAHAEFFRELAAFERKHAEIFEEAIRRHGGRIPRARPKVTHVLFATFARLFGVGAVLPVLHREEAQGIEVYRRELTELAGDECRNAVDVVIPDELDHEVSLWRRISGPDREEIGGGRLRSAILGANDGLGSVLALVAGVAGATASNQTVLIAGIAGLIAGAASMAASNYISVKSEQESYVSRKELTEAALDAAPTVKREQLKAHYRARGFSEAETEVIVSRIEGNQEEMLRALLAAEYGLTTASFENPLRLGWWTGFAFIVAGAVPVVPFLFAGPTTGLLIAVAASGVALFVAGVLRTLVTLRQWLRSGLEMLLIGMGSAVVTYAVGLLIGPSL